MPPHDIPHSVLSHDQAVDTGPPPDRALRVGIGGPVGCGKTTLVGSLCRLLRDELSLVVVTNDIFTSEDAMALQSASVLAESRIVAVETGCCPHTAIRDDIAANLDAVERLEQAHDRVDITLVESGGDNLTAIFSRGLVDVQIFVVDTAGGDDIPRKGGPGVALADLLVINKTDLAPHVGSDVDLMVREANERRDGRPVIAASLVTPEGASEISGWVRQRLDQWRPSR